jgi:drug/metabolite transporter (DMT)-like permease
MSHLVGVGLALLATLALATQSLGIRLVTAETGLRDVLTVVFTVNVAVLVPLGIADVALSGGGLSTTAIAAFAVAGVLGSLLGRVCYFLGIAKLGASRAESLKSLLPLVALAGAVLVLGEQLTWPLIAGISLLITGVLVVVSDTRQSAVTTTGRQLWRDVSFPLAAALLYGIDPVLSKIGLAAGGSPISGVAVRAVAAGSVFGLYLAWVASRGERVRPANLDRWLIGVAVANTIYLAAFYAALSLAPVAVVAPIVGASPLFVVAGGALFLQNQERVTPRLVAGALIVVVGVVTVAIV